MAPHSQYTPRGWFLGWVLVNLSTACGSTPVYILLAPQDDSPITRATLQVERVDLEDCKGNVRSWALVETLDFLAPRSLSLPNGEWCAMSLRPPQVDGEATFGLSGVLHAIYPIELDAPVTEARVAERVELNGDRSFLVLYANNLIDPLALEGARDPVTGQVIADSSDVLAYQTAARLGSTLMWGEQPPNSPPIGILPGFHLDDAESLWEEGGPEMEGGEEGEYGDGDSPEKEKDGLFSGCGKEDGEDETGAEDSALPDLDTGTPDEPDSDGCLSGCAGGSAEEDDTAAEVVEELLFPFSLGIFALGRRRRPPQ